MFSENRAFKISERLLVQKLYEVLYGMKSENRYRIDGVPRDEFLKLIKQPALRRAVTNAKMKMTELEHFRKIEFYLEACIEQGYIKDIGNRLRLTAKGYKFISWHYWTDIFQRFLPLLVAVISLGVALAAAYYTGVQAHALREEIRISTAQESGTFVIDLNNQLRNGSSSFAPIIAAISNEKALKNFSDEQKDSYLIMWELIDDLIENQLINADTAYDAFSSDVESAYCSPAIKQYILTTRRLSVSDADDYDGFISLAQKFLLEDNHDLCPVDYIESMN